MKNTYELLSNRKGSVGNVDTTVENPDHEYKDSVLDLQKKLNKLGARPRLTTDGIMGKATKEAIKDFQRENELTPDGIYGPITRDALNDAIEVLEDKGKGTAMGGAGTAGTVLTEAADKMSWLTEYGWIFRVLFIALILAGLYFFLRPQIKGLFNK